jgi:hypothetical protein
MWLRSLPLLAAACAVPMACSAPGKGALILAISTDMQTPRDVSVISVLITTDSVVKYDYLGSIADGTVNLPSTLAIVEPDDPSAQVRVRVIGFQGQTARVLRDVLTTVPHQRTALLRLPLNFLDDGSGIGMLPSSDVPGGAGGAPDGTTTFDPDTIASSCDLSAQQTSVAGQCVNAVIDSSKLPAYGDGEVFGGGGPTTGSCFDVQSCFPTATAVAGLDMSACSFALPEGADPAKLNLAFVTSDQTGALIGNQYFVPLESDPGEGWTLQGSTVTMVPGVCAKLTKSGAQLYVSSGPCAPKTESSPVCEPTVAPPPDAGTAGDKYCAWVTEVDQQCGGATDCPTEDESCPSWIGYLSTPYLDAFTTCFTPAAYCADFGDGGDLGDDAGAALDDCLYMQFSAAPLTVAQNQLAADFCKQCPDGTSTAFPQGCSKFWWTCLSSSVDGEGNATCSQCFYGPSSCSGADCGACGGEAEGEGLLFAYSDSALAQIDQQCTGLPTRADGSATDCGQSFADCANAVESTFVPTCDGGTGFGDAGAALDAGAVFDGSISEPDASATACPSTQPPAGSVCTNGEGAQCAYAGSSGATICTCLLGADKADTWNCGDGGQ